MDAESRTGEAMAEAAARRRLAAILAADVVGYSRLMEAAEVATLDRVKAHRAELIDPLLAAHGGRLIKLMGDGSLVEFPSVVEAVACALDIQQGIAQREAGRPADEAIRLRIGINLGDVLVEGDDLYGDGVNIAARLEGLAEPGGIVLSAAAFDQVVGKLPVGFRDLGERNLKNIARPVRVYALDSAGRPAARAAGRPGRRWRVPVLVAGLAMMVVLGSLAWFLTREAVPGQDPQPGDRPAIAVLPFTDPADPADDYFADGLTVDIANALARFGDLAVIDPAASFAVRERASDLGAVGRALGARYVVRGTVRRDRQRLRATAQLVEVPGGTIRWSESYEVPIADLFDVQDDITRQLAGAMAVRLDQIEQQRVAAHPPDSLEVYDLVLRGRQLTGEGSRAGNREARRVLAEAVAKDPDYAPAHAALGWAHFNYALNGWTEFPEDAIREAEHEAHAALALDPDLASASRLLGSIFISRRQVDLALAEFDRAIQANPSDASSYDFRGNALMWAGDHAAAVASLQAAQKLNPRLGYTDLGVIYFLTGRYQDSIAALTRGLPSERAPQARAFAVAVLAAAYAVLGEMAAAAQTRAELAKVAPFFDPAFFVSQFRQEADRTRMSEGLAKAGIGG
jgi:adenylate cyclase